MNEGEQLMAQVYISLNRGLLVKQFVNDISAIEGRMEIVTRYAAINARSVMGIYTQDLSSPLALRIENDTPENMEILKPYIIL
jgi:hypothetical protein